MHKDFGQFVANNWDKYAPLGEALKQFFRSVREWNSQDFW